MNSVYFISLGCPKNMVDAEIMLGKLGGAGYHVVEAPEQAKMIVVNTCSFINIAKEESIETILNMASYKDEKNGQCELLVVTGCMPQRYASDLARELPEVDLLIGTNDYAKIDDIVSDHLQMKEVIKTNVNKELQLPSKIHVSKKNFLATEKEPRINSSPFYTAWLKVSEGCDRKCTFCIIPTIRGTMRSRTEDSVVQEARRLAETGVKEINLIAQDLSMYGFDFSSAANLQAKSKEGRLVKLLRSLEKVEGIEWIRALYHYPDYIGEDFIELMRTSEKFCNYLDMPVQHFSNQVLKRMNRHVTGELLLEKIAMLKDNIPDVVLRTSVIVGFPGETEEDFETLLEGMAEAKFNNLGVFKYSDEEDTAAHRLKNKLPQKIINERYQIAYKLQKKISKQLNKGFLGKELKVLVEGPHHDTDLLWQGRFYGQAPDIDGKVIINEGSAKVGQIVTVKIQETHDYDLVGSIL